MFKGQSKLLVRADAGPKVGTGHVMRTLALGQAWKQRGGTVTFACGELPRGLIKRIEAENFQVFRIKNHDCDGADAKDTSEIASVVQPNWIVLDGYRFDDAYQRAIRETKCKLLVIDDYGHASHQHADLIVNQNVYASPNQYSGPCRGKVMAGPKYVLLRSEFGNPNRNSVEPKRIVSEARRILVTFGGADPDNWTLKSLQVLSDLNRKKLVVDCVVGACYQHVAELEMFKKTANMSLRIHRNIDRMSQLMARVDLAITAGGSTCYELAHCGVPAIVASIAENQVAISRAMNERGVMVSIDESLKANARPSTVSCLSDSRLKEAIRSLINNAGQRQSMSEEGKRMVDGNGADRIARAMAAGTFSIRAATMEDVNTLWHWQNDPEVRSVSFSSKPIPFTSFSSQLTKLLDNSRIQLWIVEDSQSQPIGQVRFDFKDPAKAPVISIVVDQARRGRGLGTLMIGQACEEFFLQTNSQSLVAQIKPGNVASEKAFRAAGFSGIEPAIVNGKMAMQLQRNRNSENNAAQSQEPSRKSA